MASILLRFGDLASSQIAAEGNGTRKEGKRYIYHSTNFKQHPAGKIIVPHRTRCGLSAASYGFDSRTRSKSLCRPKCLLWIIHIHAIQYTYPPSAVGLAMDFVAYFREDYLSTFRNQPQDTDMPTNFEACSHPSRPTEIKWLYPPTRSFSSSPQSRGLG